MSSIGEELEALEDEMLRVGASRPEITAARKARLQSYVDAAPAGDTKGRGDDARARAMFPTTKISEDDGWVEYYDRRPDMLKLLLGDIYRITKSNELEVKKTGRRPRAINGNLDELYDMLVPKFAMVPFEKSMPELMGTMSLRAFASKIPMHHVQLSRLISGERQILKPHDPRGSMALLEVIAKAGKVSPAYFMEWRQLYVWSVLDEVLGANPNYSIGMVRQLNRAREGRVR